MITGRYRFAEKTVEVHSLFGQVHEYCKDYQTDGPYDFTVTVTEDDIAYERSRSEQGNNSSAYLEELAVYRKISEKMPEFDTVLFHCSAIAVDGKAYLFTAPSGTGKSTHAALWRKLLGDRAVMINDDKPLIRISDDVTVYGTPYNGKHRLSTDIAVPLKAVCILGRSEANHIEKITKAEAYPFIMQQVYRPNDVTALQKTMVLIDRLCDKTEFYRLGCNMDISAARTSFEFMSR